MKPAARVTAVPNSEGLSFAHSAQIPTAARLTPPSPRAFDVDTRFAGLRIAGKVLKVVVRERFAIDDSLRIATALSGHKAKESAWRLWRKVCSLAQPTEICGWAAFEHQDYFGNSTSTRQEAQEVRALHVSTITVAEGGQSLGYLRPSHGVYNVIFIQKVGGRAYERVGVGRLFGKGIEEGYRTSANCEIELN